MFGLFKNYKNEMNKGKTVACLKGYLTKSAVMLEAELEVHAIIDIYSNALVDMADKLFDANRKTKISPYTMSLACLWKAIELQYEFNKIESLGSVVVNALLMIGEHIEDDANLQSSFSEIDKVIYLDITKRMEENRENLLHGFTIKNNTKKNKENFIADLSQVLLDEVLELEKHTDDISTYISNNKQLIDIVQYGSFDKDYIAWYGNSELLRFSLPNASSGSTIIFIKGTEKLSGLDISVDFNNEIFSSKIDDRIENVTNETKIICDDFAERMEQRGYYKSIY